MKLFTLVPTLLFCAAVLSAQDAAQSPNAPAKKSNYVSTIGEVLSIDAAAKQVKVKTDKGEEVTIALQDQTSFLRMPPGEKELTKATRIELKDVGVGDRVLARTRTLEGGGMSPAASIILMTKSDLAEFHEKSRAEWEKRGTVGTVASIDPAAKTIVIAVPAGMTPKDVKNVTIDPIDKVVYRRNPPGTWKFEDAKASSLAEIKVGDRLHVLGDKNEDGSHIKAEEIVAYTTRNVNATVVSIDPAANTIKVNDLAAKKQQVVVKLMPETSIKRLPEQLSMRLARLQNASAVGSGGEGGPRGGGARSVGGPPAGGPGGGPDGGPGRGAGMRGASLPQIIEQLPQITLADLKVGDALVIYGVPGNDASEMTATRVIAGVEAILTAPSKGGGASAVGGSWNFGGDSVPQ